MEVDLNLGFCGDRPASDGLYISKGSYFMKAVSKFYDDLKASLERLSDEDRQMDGRKDLPELFRTKYHRDLLDPGRIEGLQAKGEEKVECSLVNNVAVAGVGKSFGHLIHVPDFGKISLADLTVNHNSFNLTMINLHLGCIADGSTGVGTCVVNGQGGTH